MSYINQIDISLSGLYLRLISPDNQSSTVIEHERFHFKQNKHENERVPFLCIKHECELKNCNIIYNQLLLNMKSIYETNYS
jgi:hypothetical protein